MKEVTLSTDYLNHILYSLPSQAKRFRTRIKFENIDCLLDGEHIVDEWIGQVKNAIGDKRLVVEENLFGIEVNLWLNMN